MSATKPNDPSETAFYQFVIAAIEDLYVNYADEIDDKITVNMDDAGALSDPMKSEISRMQAVAAEAEQAINRLHGLADRARVRAAGMIVFPDEPGSGVSA